jgi:hypothetical protein
MIYKNGEKTMSTNFMYGKFWMKLRELFKKTISMKLFLFVVILLLLPHIIQYLNHGFLNFSGSASDTYEGLGIKDLIRKVKMELYESDMERKENLEEPLFELKDFDLEIAFIVKTQTRRKGKVGYNLITLDSEMQTGTENVQKIKLHMTAIPPRKQKKIVEGWQFPIDSNDVVDIDKPPPIKKGENHED